MQLRNRIGFILFLFFLYGLIGVSSAFAKPNNSGSLIVRKIEASGMRKIEKDAILAKVVTKSGQVYNDDLVRADIESIFKTGFFYDIRVTKNVVGGEIDLTYTVIEKPSIAEVEYSGNNELKDEEVAEAAGVKSFEIINQAKIKEAVEKVQKLYEDKGYFLAKVDYRLDDIKKDETVKLVFNIKENEKVRVRKITFLGNRKVLEGTLKDNLLTQEGGYFSFLSGSGAYKQDMFDFDVGRLHRFYYSQGYVQVKIDRPQVYVTPDKRGIYITIRIEEGDQFNVGDIDFSGDLLFSREELFEAIKINKSDVFNFDTLQMDLAELTAKYGDQGYAFANVIPRTKVNEKERKVDVVFDFDKGNKVYFGQINVIGNTKTRDKVIRRELKIAEGELYNETRKRQSKDNVQRLGYFEDGVNFKQSTSPDKPDILNLDIVVKEKNTGSIQLTAGYSSSVGFTFGGSVNQSNFLGKGQRFGAKLDYSNSSKTFSFSFTEPYFNDSLWSVGLDIYRSESGQTDYLDNRVGAGVTLGHPIYEDVNAYLRFKEESIDLQETYTGTTLLTDYSVFPLSTLDGRGRSVTGTITYDKRNDRLAPSGGQFASFNYEYAGLGGDLNYTKATATYRWYKKVIWDLVWRNNLSYGRLNSLDGDKAAPFTETFKLGGPYSLRGYRFYRVGRRVFSQKYYDQIITKPNMTAEDAAKRSMRMYGGNQQMFYSTEMEFPMIAEAGIKGVLFYDIGQAEDEISTAEFYSDIGFGIRWFSPIGPLRFEWGFPLERDPVYHEPVNFEFSIGTPY